MSFPGSDTTTQAEPVATQTVADDPFAEAREKLDEGQAPAWKPVKDPAHPREVVGRVVKIERVTIATGDSAPVVTLEDEHGRLFSIWLWHTTLLSGFQRMRPALGDVVAVRYEGEQQSEASGRRFHKYSVGRAGAAPATEFDWDDADPARARNNPDPVTTTVNGPPRTTRSRSSVFEPAPDVRGFYQALGVELPRHGPNGQGWLAIRCFLPGHKDRHKSASVHADTGAWKCFTCNRKGSPFTAAVERLLTRQQAAQLARRHGLWIETGRRRPGLADTTIPAPLPPVYQDDPADPPAEFDWLATPPKGRRREFEYVDENGKPVTRTVRVDVPGEQKRFWQERFTEDGWQPGLEGVPRLVIYRLPAVRDQARVGGRVYVVEGEKAVQALERVGLVASCSPMGAGKWQRHYSDMLEGCKVTPIPDCDQPGREHMLDVMESCHNAGVHVTEPLELGVHYPAGYDIVDLLAQISDTVRACNPEITLGELRHSLRQAVEHWAGRCLRRHDKSVEQIRARWAKYQAVRDRVEQQRGAA